jgi:hypothetical protein
MDNCKVCGTLMEDFEGYDSEYYPSEHYEWVKAYCPHCRKWYRWVEVYKLTSIEDFEEDT